MHKIRKDWDLQSQEGGDEVWKGEGLKVFLRPTKGERLKVFLRSNDALMIESVFTI